MLVPKLLRLPHKLGFWAKKRPNLAQNWNCGPNIGIFGPFDLMPDQKTMRTSCLGGFSIMWVPKLLLNPSIIRYLAQKRPNLVKNMHFWSFQAKHWHFLPISSHARPKINANKVLRWVLHYMGNKTFDFSSKNQDFCPRTNNFGPKFAFLFILGQALLAHLVPCWWVGWWL